MVTIKDKDFEKFISHDEISDKIKLISDRINEDYKTKKPLFIAILNGSFIFAADLLKEINVECEISFVKLASYEEMESTGNVKQLIGLNDNIFNRDVVIIEDIIDTGRTIVKILEEFKSLGANSIEIATLLRKPKSEAISDQLKYVGFQLPEVFVLGYGLDYDGLGRNLKDLYKLKEE
ncbi:hypoxanthine phosphoribosyltransferase [Fulvivirga sp. M361]|uniref:hypoxanthine phosphoribosyltransferase n=1 Tax=Fulvivirga sp. M361 TaxID=2594266 RepID=UPI00117BD9B0|nr:hypoxanthine phosphoribosyltransferase [Fulvivirga sp. M361]TRX61283.1 hypoxanthine phosphoribosyltransferase [Fulvivirga sp. M361]